MLLFGTPLALNCLMACGISAVNNAHHAQLNAQPPSQTCTAKPLNSMRVNVCVALAGYYCCAVFASKIVNMQIA